MPSAARALVAHYMSPLPSAGACPKTRRTLRKSLRKRVRTSGKRKKDTKERAARPQVLICGLHESGWVATAVAPHWDRIPPGQFLRRCLPVFFTLTALECSILSAVFVEK